MKTAEEWANEAGETVMLDCFAGDRNALPGEPTIKLIRQIQLDAFKAGAKWAAKIATTRRTMDKYPAASVSAMNDRTISINQSILSAAQQLTELPK